MNNKLLIALISVAAAVSVIITGAAIIYSRQDAPDGNSSTFSNISSDLSSNISSNTSSEESSSELTSIEVSSNEVSSTAPKPNPDVIYPGEKYYDVYLAVKDLDNTRNVYDFGFEEVDGQKRPYYPMIRQEKYGQYGMEAIGENSGYIYLTIDEGWENGYTPQILDTLKAENVKATFFVTMSYVKGNPALVKRMIDEGHVVGNHSVTHPDMTKISIKKCIYEIMDLHNYMKENYNYEMHLFRPAEGTFSIRSLEIARLLGYRTVEWSFGYYDWEPSAQPDKLAAFNNITGHTHGGAIYLLHAVSKTNTEIFGDVFDYWRSQGYDIGPFPNVAPDKEMPAVKPAPTPQPPTSSETA